MPRPRSDIADRILGSARARFLVEGVDGASLRRIAREAKTSIGMVYYYFPTKDDLFLAVVEQVYAGLLDQLSVELSDDRTVSDRLAGLFGRLSRLSDEELDVVRIVIREALISSTRLQRLVERFSRGHVPLVIRTIRDGLAGGAIDPRHPLPAILIATATLAAVPQVVRSVATRDNPPLRALFPPPESLAAAMMEILMAGIGPPKKPIA